MFFSTLSFKSMRIDSPWILEDKRGTAAFSFNFQPQSLSLRIHPRMQRYLYVEVDLGAPAQVREVPSCLEVSSSGVGIQFIHLLLGLQRQSALIEHLRFRGNNLLHKDTRVDGCRCLLCRTYINNGDRNVFYFMRLHIRVLTVER